MTKLITSQSDIDVLKKLEKAGFTLTSFMQWVQEYYYKEKQNETYNRI